MYLLSGISKKTLATYASFVLHVVHCAILCACSPAPPVGRSVGHIRTIDASCQPPSETSKKSRPVWILPKTNIGWSKGGVDQQTGDWHSGEYVGTIIEPGHWATQEEAELGSQPYIIAGENQPIIPEQATTTPPPSNP
jgi:hypothetical protein